MIPVGKSLMTLMTNDLNDHFSWEGGSQSPTRCT